MINKGLMTKSKLMPFGTHKDPAPEVLPGRVDADASATMVTPEMPAESAPLTPAALPDSAVRAQVNNDEETQTSSQATAPTEKSRKKRSSARKSGEPSPEAGSSTSDKGGIRYKLQLRVDQPVLEAVEKYFAGLDDAQKVSAKQAVMRAFRKYLLETPPRKSAYAPAKPAIYRVDMMVPASFQETVMQVEEAGVFEAPTPVLSRNFSPMFAAFVKNTLGR